MDDAVVGVLLPEEIYDEPQMALVTGDVIQISSQRQDGWAFGTKVRRMVLILASELCPRLTQLLCFPAPSP